MDAAFDDILGANAEYAATFGLTGLNAAAAKELGVLTCIDSRIEPLAMLGLVPGDAKILRNAGARVTADVVRTLAIATHLLNVRRIMIVSHTDCAMATTDETLRENIARANPELPVEDLDPRAARDPRRTLLDDANWLRASGMLAPGVVVGTFEYDVHTGVLQPIDE